MIKNVLATVLIPLVLVCGLCSGASAQSGPNCPTKVSYWSWDPAPTAFFDCDTSVDVEGSFPCLAYFFWCVPPDAAPEVCLACAAAAASHPINLAFGNTYIEENDIRIPGLSGGLSLNRTWNSMWPATQSAYQIGIFGPNWRSNFEERVFMGSDHFMKYGRGDGSFWSFGYGSPTGGAVWTLSAPANVVATLIPGSSYWTIAFQNGEQRLFDNSTGHLIEIIDRNGNTTQLSYDSLNRLATVTDPASRHLYFSYGSGSYLVSGVTSDFGESVSYSYDSYGRLSQVTEPDGSTLSFTFDSHSFITSVLDASSKVIEAHTYDSSGRGLTASRANGVEAVTLSY